MKLLRNAFTLFSRPALAGDYFRFRLNQARHGEFVREFPTENLMIGGLSGFSEFHSCARFANEAEHRFLTKFEFSQGPILDVGGNLGIFSLLMARRFPDRTIHAFEPNPSTFQAMCANFHRNGCSRAIGYPQAVAAHNGGVRFQANPIDRATTHIVPEESSSAFASGTPVVEVSCVTLDSFAESQNINTVSLLKVDVEGYEDAVFRGAERLLSNGLVKTIYYEVCPDLARRAGFAADSASRRLLDLDYKLYALDNGGGLQPVELNRIGAIRLENWVAIRDANPIS